MVLALAMLDEPNWPLPARLLAGVGVALTVAVAVLPPELIGTALVAVGSHPRISPRDQWNLYDNTPLVWTAAMIARFGFLPVCLTRLLNRRAGADLAAQACTDGAGPIQRIAYTRLPFLWRPLLAGCLMVGCLTLSESAAGVLVQPPQFFGGSLAVHVDAQMHYGRQNETIALSLMLMIPAVLAAVVAPLLVKLPGRFRRAGGTTGSRRAGSLARRLNGSLGSTGVWCVALAVIALLAGCERADPDVTAVDAVFGGPGLGTGEFSYPRGIAVSPVDGCVFVVDKSPTARIQRFSPDGEYEHQWCMPEAKNGKPTGLYVDRHNRVWVPDTHYHRVITYDRDGRELFRFGARGEGPGEFIFPTDVVLDREGNIYVGEYGDNDRISKFSPDREYLFSFADKASGEGRVERPTGLAIDEDNTLWVADACHHRICRYGPDGRFLRAFGSPGTERDNLNYPYGLVLEGSGTLLVADRGNNRIVRFDRAGNFVGSWGIHGRDRGQISQPWGVAVAEDGRVYCLDSWNNRVQLIDW
jgi:DNA-binding beta-propeller fold protein YncE/ABC-type molybdate transport system permease subunit